MDIDQLLPITTRGGIESMAGKIPPHRLILLDSDHPANPLRTPFLYLDAVGGPCFGWIDSTRKKDAGWAFGPASFSEGQRKQVVGTEQGTRPPPAQNGIDDAAGNRLFAGHGPGSLPNRFRNPGRPAPGTGNIRPLSELPASVRHVRIDTIRSKKPAGPV